MQAFSSNVIAHAAKDQFNPPDNLTYIEKDSDV